MVDSLSCEVFWQTLDTKTIDRITDLERGQILNYLKITQLRVGLILNFKRPTLEWERLVL